MAEQHDLYWKGSHVGVINITASDMWYFEGTFTAIDSKVSADFVKAVERLELKTVYRNPVKGISCVLSPTEGPDKKWNAFVLGKLVELLVLRLSTTAHH